MTSAFKITIGGKVICADGFIPISEENAIQFYIVKDDLDYIPPIKIDEKILSDFGRNILFSKSEE